MSETETVIAGFLAAQSDIEEGEARQRARDLIAILAEDRQVIVSVPEVGHKGPCDTDASALLQVAWNLERDYPAGGSNVRRAVSHTKALEQVATDGGWAIWRDLDNGFYVVGEESGVIPEGADHVDGEHNPVAHVYIATDAAFIVHARTALPALVAAVERVQALHTPDEISGDYGLVYCRECGDYLPCPTIRALETP